MPAKYDSLDGRRRRFGRSRFGYRGRRDGRARLVVHHQRDGEHERFVEARTELGRARELARAEHVARAIRELEQRVPVTIRQAFHADVERRFHGAGSESVAPDVVVDRSRQAFLAEARELGSWSRPR